MKALARYLTEKYISIVFDTFSLIETFKIQAKTSTLCGGKLFYQYNFKSHEGQLGRLGCMDCDEV